MGVFKKQKSIFTILFLLIVAAHPPYTFAANPFQKCELFLKNLFVSKPQIIKEPPAASKIYPNSASELLEMGELQRALWKSKSPVFHKQVEDFLQRAVIVSTETGIGGKSGAQKVLLEGIIDGKKIRVPAILKNSSVDREIAAHKIDQFLKTELTPLITVRQCGNQKCSIQLFVGDAVSGKDLNIERWSGYDDTTMDMYDYLISNTDRHHENFLITLDERRLVAIDHGQSLGFHGFRNTLSPKNLNIVWDEKTNKFFSELKNLSDEKIRNALEEFLTQNELEDLLIRKQKLIEYLEKSAANAGAH